MSNTYYKYEKEHAGAVKDITLSAVGNENDIDIMISNRHSGVGVWINLTEQEQDDLIVGILERRGVKSKFSQYYLQRGLIKGDPIAATGTEQSRIYPVTT